LSVKRRSKPIPPATLTPASRIVIAGAGSIGCYIGGRLVQAGRNVTLLTRGRLAALISERGLRVSALDHGDAVVLPDRLQLATDAATALAPAELILVTVKCRDTKDMADLIAEHAPESAVVVSMQNGVDNVDALRAALGRSDGIVAAMVPFNVVQTHAESEPPRFHRATTGTIKIGAGVPGLADILSVPGAEVGESADIDAVLWSKLLINLNNALNALSDLPLLEEFGDRRWRKLLARQMREAFPVLRRDGIALAALEGVHPRLMARVLRWPDWLFRIAARNMMAMDETARSSMWEDLQKGRLTEIDCIQGAIARRARALGLAIPLTMRVMELIRAAEAAGSGAPGLTPEYVAKGT
jgi:2-dehydropantoate 2-reductase